jgi:hypothetical protein
LFSVGSKLKSNVGAASVFCSVTSKFEKLKSNSGFASSTTGGDAGAASKLNENSKGAGSLFSCCSIVGAASVVSFFSKEKLKS